MRVDKETAIALRDLGYSNETEAYYYKDDTELYDVKKRLNWNANQVFERFSAPTLEEVVEFFDSLGIYVIPNICLDKEWMCEVFTVLRSTGYVHEVPQTVDGRFPSRSSATLAGIKKAIEIKSQQNKTT